MKYPIRTISEYHIAYGLMPYKRNQDVIQIIPGKGDCTYAVSVVDGWNWKEKLADDRVGRRAARYIAKEYPQTFLELDDIDFVRRAETASTVVDKRFLKAFPKYASAVTVFLFSFMNQDIIVYVGKGIVLLWDGKQWTKPVKIGDYFLDETKFGFSNEVSRFFGRGELKGDPLYSCKPDVVVCRPETPVFLATDGLEDVFTLEEITQIIRIDHEISPRELTDRLLTEASRCGTQRDDISVLVRL